MNILGISAYYHDSAAALVIDGRPVVAAQEERYTRVKNDPSFPSHAIRFCLDHRHLSPTDLDAVVFYDKPILKFDRILSTFLQRAPKGYPLFRRAIPAWLKEKLWIPNALRKALPGAKRYLFAPHHFSHAAAAYYLSPFEQAAVLTVDGVGEWATCTHGIGHGPDLRLEKEIRFPHSLGLLYSAFTAYLGFSVNEGEYKVMGLAPYGKPRYLDTIFQHLVQRNADGSFEVRLGAFDYLDRPRMTNETFHALFGGPPRVPDGPLEPRHLDIAASIQRATEELMLHLVRHIARTTDEKNLCLSGGVALNCSANGRILREGPFERLWVQPAAGDAGGALGAALVAHTALGGDRPPCPTSDRMSGALLGPEFAETEVEAALTRAGLTAERLDPSAMCDRTAAALASGDVVGWFQGRMEFGPRALGNRSILADPRDPGISFRVNRKIKFREGFRPFAPAVLEKRAAEFFEITAPSPYMVLVYPLAQAQRLSVDETKEGLAKRNVIRSTIPAVTHVDDTARVQTVNPVTNPLFHTLIQAFERKTGCPLVLNTSFNIRGEPIVCSPDDAIRCYFQTSLDALALGPFWLSKETME